MPARTLNDFFAGFFMPIGGGTGVNEVRAAGKRLMRTIKITEQTEEAQEITVGHGTGKEETTRSWFEEFAIERCDRIIEKKQKRNPPKGEPL